MTITAQTAKSGPYSGNGVTVVFDYTFKIVDDDDLVVTLRAADGTETVQTLIETGTNRSPVIRSTPSRKTGSHFPGHQGLRQAIRYVCV